MVRESSYLRENKQALQLLRKLDQLKAFSNRDLQSFLEMGKLVQYDSGEILIQEGSHHGWIYLLIEGEVEILKNGQSIKRLKRNGELFGEMEAVDGSPRSATIKAVTPTLVLGVDGSLTELKLKNNELAFCYTLYRLFAELLADRLRQATKEISSLRLELEQVKAELGRKQRDVPPKTGWELE
ncbi:MAG: cyclic nucleotide-binding domain-containing protein [Desulfobacteraceae bacterium]|nr:cyclic nucleotide-binding domain-containing protein [Desulfobacteraceae bacterium]